MGFPAQKEYFSIYVRKMTKTLIFRKWYMGFKMTLQKSFFENATGWLQETVNLFPEVGCSRFDNLLTQNHPVYLTKFIWGSYDRYASIYVRKMTKMLIFRKWYVGFKMLIQKSFFQNATRWLQVAVKHFLEVMWSRVDNSFGSELPRVSQKSYFRIIRQIFFNIYQENDKKVYFQKMVCPRRQKFLTFVETLKIQSVEFSRPSTKKSKRHMKKWKAL